jgi:hypothetical protein
MIVRIKNTFQVPDELTLLNFFKAEPIEAEPKDGYWCYEVTDDSNTALKVSFNTIEESFQLLLLINNREVIRISQEGAIQLEILENLTNKILRCEFKYVNAYSKVEIKIKPLINVKWSTLLE